MRKFVCQVVLSEIHFETGYLTGYVWVVATPLELEDASILNYFMKQRRTVAASLSKYARDVTSLTSSSLKKPEIGGTKINKIFKSFISADSSNYNSS